VDRLDQLLLLFTTLMGACIGSFLNVVVYRLPRGLSLSHPPSTCPSCNTRLKWYDNIPVLGWLKLAGKCRFCKNPISIRYPIVEALTAILFAGAFLALFVFNLGPQAYTAFPGDPPLPRTILTDYPVLMLWCLAIAVLLAMSLIDLETYSIPLSLCLTLLFGALAIHGLLMKPDTLGAMSISPAWAAATLAATVGLLLSLAAMKLGLLPRSFPHGEPLLDVDYRAMSDANAAARAAQQPIPYDEPFPEPMSRHDIRKHIALEVLFCLPPVLLGLAAGLAALLIPRLGQLADTLASAPYLRTLLPSLLGALLGGGIIWFTRIAGTLALGRVAMGLGDIHLLFAIGAVVGPAGAVVTFFFAPFAGLAVTLYSFFAKNRRELPYGPYLAAAALIFLTLQAPLTQYLADAYGGLIVILQQYVLL
jgi:leader peptidase (prepilin peptidase)/N-methyltransferase